ncbi:hypothetical protein CCP4SC76_1010001 [Gammaproteobacteria bacterium]
MAPARPLFSTLTGQGEAETARAALLTRLNQRLRAACEALPRQG